MSASALDERRTGLHRKAGLTPRKVTAGLRNEAVLGTLAMSIIHDLRNPLAAIHTATELLKETHLTEHQMRRLARNVHGASVRIQQVLQDYADLCRAGGNQRRPSNLRRLVVHAAERIAAVAEAQAVTIVQEVPADLVTTLDRRRISSVLANLLANALEVMPAGGSIHISGIRINRSVVIRVRDTGPGVPPGIRNRLFEPFVTACKPNGWGLGLAHARQIVLEHGGEIWLEDLPGQGACFAFSLPVL